MSALKQDKEERARDSANGSSGAPVDAQECPPVDSPESSRAELATQEVEAAQVGADAEPVGASAEEPAPVSQEVQATLAPSTQSSADVQRELDEGRHSPRETTTQQSSRNSRTERSVSWGAWRESFSLESAFQGSTESPLRTLTRSGALMVLGWCRFERDGIHRRE